MPRTTTIYCLYMAIVFTTFLGVTWAAKDKNTLNKKHRHVKRQAGQQLPLVSVSRQNARVYQFRKDTMLSVVFHYEQ